MNRIEQLYRERPVAADFARGYLDYLTEVLAGLDADAIASFVDVLLSARERDAQIFFIGNGGSASTASHFVNDIAVGCRNSEKPFRAVCLTDNSAVLTALANDYGYEDVFVRQLQMQMTHGDVVVAISASGSSANVVGAFEYANEKGAVTVALTGFDGGPLAEMAQLVVHAPTNKGEYGPVEDVHLIVNHLVAAFLMQACAPPAATSGVEGLAER
ncbi:MAG TPA: SIS domain-containing protein [Gaiellaceae bacterium]|jgi:D-sedoheptulose 7-phosphate isomerase|nr:SIS domain-containing protein [Gaiellaceae bacterium]